MKTKFIFTIDVESMRDGGPDRDILGIVSGHQDKFGIERMMDILDAHSARGTFFLNVYEMAIHGEESLARVACIIHSRGHDLALHTHPRPMYPHYGMSGASSAEQVEILEKGVSLLERWTGKRVTAHRAGAFLANTETLRAAEAVGLHADCSMAAGSHDSVPLVDELGATNCPRRIGNLWEIPVTFFDQVRIGPWSSRRILDIEACSLPEIKRVTRWAVRHGLPTVCILMHSFSFCRHGKPDRRVIRRFSALLAWLGAQDRIEIATVEETCLKLDVGAVPESPPQNPSTGVWLTWRRAVLSWNDGWKNLVVAVAGVGGLAVFAGGLGYLGYWVLKH